MKLDGRKSYIGAALVVLGALGGALLKVLAPGTAAGADLQAVLVTTGLALLGYGIADKVRKLTEEVKAE